MKKVYFYAQDGSLTIGEETVKGAKISEMTIEFFPTEENTAFESPVSLQGRTLTLGICSTQFETEVSPEFWEKFIAPHPLFRETTVQIPGYISEEYRQRWLEIENQGFIFFLRFRQRIYPALCWEATFLTTLEICNEKSIIRQ